MIDVEKFICSLMEQDKGAMHFGNIALKEQGFKYKDGAIVEIEPKKELSEFENIVDEIADTSILNAYGVKELAKRLLNDAKKQLQQEFDKQLEQAYKNADKVQYGRGYKKAIEDAAGFIYNNMAGDDNSIRYFHTFMEQKLKELSQG